MPGRKDSSVYGASYIGDWELYRSGITASDTIDTFAHLRLITDVIDLSRNDNGFNNQIWVHPHLTAGTGTVTLGLYLENNGTWNEVVDIELVETALTAQADKSIHKWTGLIAGIYRIAVTAVAGGAHWDLHVAHT